jgi:hypothetical protein
MYAQMGKLTILTTPLPPLIIAIIITVKTNFSILP